MSKDVIFELSNRWSKAGLQKNDILLLHSNLTRLILEFRRKKIQISAKTVVNSFFDVIGKNGTLILPLFNFDFTKGSPFSYHQTRSQMGYLTEEFRKKFNIVRTGHPVYSFGVMGGEMDRFKNIDNVSAYSQNSPFGLIHKLNGKIGILDLEEQNSMTFYHYIEEQEQVSYRYFKNFSGNYINKNNVNKKKTYSIYVRKLEDGVLTHVNPMGEILWKEGIYNGSKAFTNSGFRLADCNDIFSCVQNLIKKNKHYGILFKIKK